MIYLGLHSISGPGITISYTVSLASGGQNVAHKAILQLSPRETGRPPRSPDHQIDRGTLIAIPIAEIGG
jgi:hypothetical protein